MSEGAFSSLPLSLASDSPSFRPVRVPAAKKVPGIGNSYVINPSALSAIKCKMAAKADRPSTAHHRRRCQRGIRSLAVLTVRTHMYDDGGGPRIPLCPGRAGGGFVYLNLPLMGSSAASNARCRQLQGPGFSLCHFSRPGAADKRHPMVHRSNRGRRTAWGAKEEAEAGLRSFRIQRPPHGSRGTLGPPRESRRGARLVFVYF